MTSPQELQAGDTKTIQLTRGQFAIVDDADYSELSQYKWTAIWDRTGNRWYAARTEKRKSVRMHQRIMGGLWIDHINGNGLDNRRENLRFCDRKQNQWNSKKRKGTSQYKGVNLDKKAGKWRAQIKYNNRKIWLGRHDKEEDAALAYDSAARRLFGEFARPNFAMFPN